MFGPALVLALVSFAFLACDVAQAASGTWTGGGSDGEWTNAGNWAGGTIPGVSSGVYSTDQATFNNTGTANLPVVINSGRVIYNVNFMGSAGSFTIGTTGGNALSLSHGAGIIIDVGLAGTGLTQTVNAPLTLQPVSATGIGVHGLANNSASATNTLVVGGAISSGTTSTTALLNLYGSNAGANNVSGSISDGAAAGGLKVFKDGTGTWTLSGANSFTRGVQIKAGTLNINSAQALGTGTLAVDYAQSFDNTSGSPVTLTTNNAQTWGG